MIRISTFLPQAMIDALKALSAKSGLTVAEHIRRAVDAYLKRVNK